MSELSTTDNTTASLKESSTTIKPSLPVTGKSDVSPTSPGRPCKYFSHVLPRIEEIKVWCRNGHTDKEICEALQISVYRFIVYKRQFSDLREALKVTKAIADDSVESSLYQRAVGCPSVEITKERRIIGKDPETKVATFGMVETKRVEKHILGNVEAIKLWLTNRRSLKWRIRTEQKTEDTLYIYHIPVIDKPSNSGLPISGPGSPGFNRLAVPPSPN